MLTIRDHQVDDYADLKDMDATDVGVLSDEDRDCLAELADYLVTSGGWQRFAVWLLHKHFLPEDGEVFVERAIARPPQTHTTPIERAAYSRGGPARHIRAGRHQGDRWSGPGGHGIRRPSRLRVRSANQR